MINNILNKSLRRWILLAFLATLYMVLLESPTSVFGRLMFLAHIGIGLIWQPFIQPNRRLGFVSLAFVSAATGLLALNLDWELLALWLMILTGVVGGKVFLFPNRWERIFHLAALTALVLALLTHTLPFALQRPASLPSSHPWPLFFYPLLLIFMVFLPHKRDDQPDPHDVVDYVYGVIVFLLMAVISFGTISYSLFYQLDYFDALLVALSLVAGTLLLLGFIWNPSAGFSGLSSALGDYIFSLGTPFERWLEFLSKLAGSHLDSTTFLSEAAVSLPQHLPEVIGVRWRVNSAEGISGYQDGVASTYAHEQLTIILISTAPPSSMQHWQADLSIRLLAEFYANIWRGEELERMLLTEALHSTGARIAHDVKNLLQSLEALCAAAQQPASLGSHRFMSLMQRQLPEIAVRLRNMLTKLSHPTIDESPVLTDASEWFKALQTRHCHNYISFEASYLPPGTLIDSVLFSSITENLLHNCQIKRQTESDIQIDVKLALDNNVLCLSVTDNGSAISRKVLPDLFRKRVASASGLGIGLLQCATLADQRGAKLNLQDNASGNVSFCLRTMIMS